VLIAIHFDNQPCSGAKEINDISTDELLSAEARTAKLFEAQRRPEFLLCIRGIRA